MAATAVNAVSDLKQKPQESGAQFLDRVVLAVNRQNFNIPEIQKTTAMFRSVFDASIISHFGAGLKHEISSVVPGQADAPNTVQGMLEAAEAVEAEQAKIGNPGMSALAIHTEEADLDPLADLTARFDKLVGAIGFKRRRPYDKSKAKCYNCNKLGHFCNECPEPQRPRSSGGDDRTSKKKRGGSRRAQNAAEDKSESGPEEDEEEDDEEHDSGNY